MHKQKLIVVGQVFDKHPISVRRFNPIARLNAKKLDTSCALTESFQTPLNLTQQSPWQTELVQQRQAN
jgi:hypothetical protein